MGARGAAAHGADGAGGGCVARSRLSVFQDVQAAVLLLMLLFSFARSETPCPKTAEGLDPLQHLLVEDVVPHAIRRSHVAMRLKRIKQDRRMERPEAQGNEDWVKMGDALIRSSRCACGWLACLRCMALGAPDGQCLLCQPGERVVAAHVCTGHGTRACALPAASSDSRGGEVRLAQLARHRVRVVEARRGRGAHGGAWWMAQFGASALRPLLVAEVLRCPRPCWRCADEWRLAPLRAGGGSCV